MYNAKFSMVDALGMAAATGIVGGPSGQWMPDTTLVLLSAIVCAAAMEWGVLAGLNGPSVTGTTRKALPLLAIYLVVFTGYMVLLTSANRYPPLSPIEVGCVTTAGFVAVGFFIFFAGIRAGGGLAAAKQSGNWSEYLVMAALIYLPVGVLYAQSAAILVNGQADARPPAVLRGVILKTYTTRGKGAAPYFVLTEPAAAHDPTISEDTFKVTWETYRRYQVGDEVCLTVHTGLLRFQWWAIADCVR